MPSSGFYGTPSIYLFLVVSLMQYSHVLVIFISDRVIIMCSAALVKWLIHYFISDAGKHAHSRSLLEVPIFWFIQNEPLLVDKHYQAKALSDMVIVVQSESSAWESHLQCNGRSLLWDLRLNIRYLWKLLFDAFDVTCHCMNS